MAFICEDGQAQLLETPVFLKTVTWRILKNTDRDPYEAKNEELSNEKVRMAISYIRKGS